MVKKIKKLFEIIKCKQYLKALLINNVAATIEHSNVLKNIKKCNTVIDIGANKGQFSLTARNIFPNARIISFEPLSEPAIKFKKIFTNDANIILHQSAIGSEQKNISMYVSKRYDSSSILPIGNNQSSIFPGTELSHTEEIFVAPLSNFIPLRDLIRPILVKIDVQGYELEVLEGCKEQISLLDFIYVECSFIELYESQPLAHEIICFLDKYSYQLKGVYNITYKNKIAIQGDFLFRKDIVDDKK